MTDTTATAPGSPPLPCVAPIRGESTPGLPTVSVQAAEGRWLRLHSAREPIREADRLIAPAFESGEPPMLIVIGLGLGYVLDAIERRSSTTRVLALEPLPDTLPAMTTRRDWSEWLSTGRLTLLSGPDYPGASDAFRLLDGRQAPPPIVVHPVVARAFPEAVTRAQHVAHQIILGAKANEEARLRFAGPYLLNTLQNLPVICSEADVSALFDVAPGVPAVVVAAGPSLDRNLADLRLIQGRVLLIAVDTALRPLLAAGIRPHLVVAADPQEVNARHLAGISDTEGIALVAEGSVDPAAFRHFAGRTFCFKVSHHHPWPWLASCGADVGLLRTWGSVLTTAFDLAHKAGCDPIVFAGADLAYTDGLSYCSNTIFDRQWNHLPTPEARAEAMRAEVAQRTTVTEPDVSGGVAVTATRFVQFRDWLVARALESAPRRVVNATGAGILHGGRIEQAHLASLAPSPVAPTEFDPHRRLGSAWAESVARRRAARVRVDHALMELAPDASVVDQWLDFAGERVSRDQIVARVTGARMQRLLRAASQTDPGDEHVLAGAVDIVEDAARAGHSSPELLDVCMKRGLWEPAASVVRALYAQRGSTRRDGLSRIAGAAKKAGQRDLALRLLREDFALRRQTADWSFQLAIGLLDAQQSDEAGSVIGTITPDELSSDRHRYAYALSLARLGRTAEAETLVRTLYERDGSLQDGLSRVGWEYGVRGDKRRCFDLLNEDRSSGRQSSGWMVNYAIALLDGTFLDNDGRACTPGDRPDLVSQVVAGIEPERVSCDRLLGLAARLCRHGMTADAQRLAESAIAASNGRPEIQARGAGVLRSCGDIHRARPVLVNLLEVGHDAPAVLEEASLLVLTLLEEEMFEEAAHLGRLLSRGARVDPPLAASLVVRLAFIAGVLAGDDSDAPSRVLGTLKTRTVMQALYPYAYRLARKAEVPLQHPTEVLAVNWIAGALYQESESVDYRRTDVVELVRWMVLADRSAEAIRVLEDRYRTDSTLTGGYTYLALFLLNRGSVFADEVRSCLDRETPDYLDDPDLLFASAAAHAEAGMHQQASDRLSRLYTIRPQYFAGERSPTVWGFLAVILKAAGHDALASSALVHAEAYDPFGHLRRNRFDRIPTATAVWPLPPFDFPF